MSDTIAPYLAILRRRLRLLVLVPSALALVALTVLLLTPRRYRATASFVASEPSSMSSSLGALGSVAAQLGIPALSAVASSSASTSAQFYGELLTSRELVRTVLTTQYDASDTGTNGGIPYRGTLVDYLEPKGKTATDSLVDAINRFTRNVLTVSVDRTTGIVRLEVQTRNRTLSALVTRRLLELVNDFNLRRRQSQAGAERDFGRMRTDAALDTLRNAEAQLASFRASNIDFSRSPRLAAREAELQRRVALAQQIYTTVAQRYELANIESVRNTPLITVVDSPEGLVEARPRYTVFITLGAGAFGLLVAIAIALYSARGTED